jgi:serine/threonine protein kinase
LLEGGQTMTRSSANMRASGDHAISGRFQLVRQLGEGGMGVVWEAVDVASGQPRAIKLVRPETTDGTAYQRFVREAEALRGVAHGNVVKIFEIARDDDGAPAIVMELLRGESLAARIEREKTLSVGQTCAILSRVTAAVATAHAAGIVHRDLKPDNVFIVADGAGGVDVRVLDFGVARKIESEPDKLTKTGTLIGTPFYMSPEQASGLKDLDGKSDVWSLAVMAFECLTGKMPIKAENYGQLLMQIVTVKTIKLASVRPDLPKPILDAIDGAFAERETRIDIAQLSAALVALADPHIAPPPVAAPAPISTRTLVIATPSTPQAVTSPTIVEPASPPRSSAGVGIAAGVLFVLAVGGAGAIYLTRTKAVQTPPPPITTTTTTAATPSAEPIAPSASASSVDTAASASASGSASASASSKKGRPKPPASGAASGHATPPATGDRLQGGVGGNVPF